MLAWSSDRVTNREYAGRGRRSGNASREKSTAAKMGAFEKARQMAIQPQLSTQEIVDRARVFAGFLTAPLESHQPPEPKVIGFRQV